jgi:hypothetical protein
MEKSKKRKVVACFVWVAQVKVHLGAKMETPIQISVHARMFHVINNVGPTYCGYENKIFINTCLNVSLTYKP